MADLELVGVAATERLPIGAVLRVTFSKAWSLALTDTQFYNVTLDIYDGLIGDPMLYPVSPVPAVNDGQPVVIDLRLLQAAVLSDVDAKLETLAGWSVSVKRIERLSTAQAAVAKDNAGATERDAVKKVQAAKDAADDPMTKLLAWLGDAEKIVAVVAVIALLVIFAPEIKALLKGASRIARR